MRELQASDLIIAIVDDDPSVREGLQSLIRSVGWTVETFASAQEFLDRPWAEAPSCLVLDLQLPGLSGLDLQKRMAEVGLETPSFSLQTMVDLRELQCRQLSPAAAQGRTSSGSAAECERILQALKEAKGMVGGPNGAAADNLQPGITQERQLARTGDVGAIREEARPLLALDERYAPFARQLPDLALGYHSKAIVPSSRRCRKGAGQDELERKSVGTIPIETPDAKLQGGGALSSACLRANRSGTGVGETCGKRRQGHPIAHLTSKHGLYPGQIRDILRDNRRVHFITGDKAVA